MMGQPPPGQNCAGPGGAQHGKGKDPFPPCRSVPPLGAGKCGCALAEGFGCNPLYLLRGLMVACEGDDDALNHSRQVAWLTCLRSPSAAASIRADPAWTACFATRAARSVAAWDCLPVRNIVTPLMTVTL